MTVDENDIEIIRLEGETNTLSNQVDTYTIESALFGALAFSGFLTIVVSGKRVISGIQQFTSNSLDIIDMSIQFKFSEMFSTIGDMMSEEIIFGAIAMETLVCSMLFLSVIVSRLRFSSSIKQMSITLNIAKAYNQKEEEINNIVLQGSINEKKSFLDQRLLELNEKILESLNYAIELYDEIKPVAAYMALFRNLGVFAFLIILITSSLLISKRVTFIFIMLSVLASLYTNFDKWTRNKKIKNIFDQLEKRIHPSRRLTTTSGDD